MEDHQPTIIPFVIRLLISSDGRELGLSEVASCGSERRQSPPKGQLQRLAEWIPLERFIKIMGQ